MCRIIKSLFLALLLPGLAHAYNLNITDMSSGTSYPAQVGGGTYSYVSDGGQHVTGSFGSKWDYGPSGSILWIVDAVGTTNASGLTITFTWNSPGAGPGSIVVPPGGGPYDPFLVAYYPAGGGPCTSNYVVTVVNVLSDPQYFQVNFSGGNSYGPYGPVPSGAPQNVTINENCGQTYTVTWLGYNYTNSILPDLNNSNGLTFTNLGGNFPTNASLPTVTPDTSSNLLWSAPASTSPATTADIHDLGNGLNNTLWTASQQSHSDDSDEVSAINQFAQQNHSDLGSLKQTLDLNRQQMHSDLSYLDEALKDLTNGSVNINFTNYATQSGQNGISNLLSQNLTAVQSGDSNLVTALNGVTDALTNVTDETNLDFATENTQAGMSNLLAAISTNILSITNSFNFPTNLATESTLRGISNLLAGAAAGTNVDNPDTNFGNYFDTNSPLYGYSVGYDWPTNYGDVQTLSSSQAQQAGLDVQEDAFTTFIDNITDFSGNVLDTYPPVDMTFDFGPYLSGGASGTMMDFDPLHTGWGPELFSVAKQLFTWLIALSFLIKVTDEAWKAVKVIMGAHGINPQAVRTVIKNTGA